MFMLHVFFLKKKLTAPFITLKKNLFLDSFKKIYKVIKNTKILYTLHPSNINHY